MMPKSRLFRVARIVAGYCVAGGLIYFLYSEKSPPALSWIIMLVIGFFVLLSRRSGVFDKNPYFPAMRKWGSRTPLRDLAKALSCFVAMMAITFAEAVAIKHGVIPDNYFTLAPIVVVIVVGGLAFLFFLTRASIALAFGPPE
jgi:hypothetical protein